MINTNVINPNDRIRGALDIPLTPTGHQQAQELGEKFKQNGPLDVVATADLSRNRDTAHAVANGAPVLETHHLRDMDYGIFTGMHSKDAIPIINKAIQKDPDRPLPGSHESFSQYKDRMINMFRLAVGASKAFPDAKIGLVINRRSFKLAEGWLDNKKTDNIVNIPKVLSLGEKLVPGAVMHITGNKDGEYGIEKTNMDKPLENGVYLIRHGLTAFNGEAYENEDGKS